MPGNRFLFIEKLSPLYEDVQSGEIFADSKFFVDCVPAFTAEEILSKYETDKKLPGFDPGRYIHASDLLYGIGGSKQPGQFLGRKSESSRSRRDGLFKI